MSRTIGVECSLVLFDDGTFGLEIQITNIGSEADALTISEAVRTILRQNAELLVAGLTE